jgi:hypothetical protein
VKEDLHAQENVELNAAIDAFTQSSFSLASLFQRGVQLTGADRLSIENNLAIVQLHYSVWVRQFGDK